ncbi:MAG: aspartate/glutamate racemase family protein [Nitratireductor sp.]|nr:aspartate/glutamate racemase family protein [Nitratireductor sp.]
MPNRIKLGILTPSSNTVLEPLTSAIVEGVPNVSAHFARFPVTEISLTKAALGQFDFEPMLQASRLLADARVNVIGWSGTSSGWLGLEEDNRLCAAITAETGIPATTSVLAVEELFQLNGVKKFSLVTPYLDEIQEKIIEKFAERGFDCVSERHLRDKGNYSYSEYSEDTIAGLVREVARDRPQAITIFCTNFRGARIAEALEKETGIAVYDTTSAVVWKSLLMAGVDPRQVTGWGSAFRTVSEPAGSR